MRTKQAGAMTNSKRAVCILDIVFFSSIPPPNDSLFPPLPPCESASALYLDPVVIVGPEFLMDGATTHYFTYQDPSV
jgi:hypothetical protein